MYEIYILSIHAFFAHMSDRWRMFSCDGSKIQDHALKTTTESLGKSYKKDDYRQQNVRQFLQSD